MATCSRKARARAHDRGLKSLAAYTKRCGLQAPTSARCARYKVQRGLPGSAGYVIVRGRRRALPATPPGRHVEICRTKGSLMMIDAGGGRHKLKRRH